jgi:predicted PurR-regulated permease PerM
METTDIDEQTDVSDRHRRRFVLVLSALLLLAFFYMISTLIIGVIGGILLWAMTSGVYRWFLPKVRGNRTAAAALAMVVTMLLVVVPITLLVVLMAADASTLADRASQWIEPYRPKLQEQLDRISQGRSIDFFGYEITMQQVAQKIEAASGQISQFLLMLIQKTAGGIARATLLLFVTLYTLFFFYLDGDAFVLWLKDILPLPHAQSQRLLDDFFATSKATLKTVVVLGAVQGTLGGLGFWVCGIPAPFFWTGLIAIASVIPAVGCHIVTVPAGILLIALGETWYGIGLIAWSLIVIANIDNFLRPWLVQREVNLHQLLVFLGTIGGIATFGFFGVVIGPVIAALLKAILDIYQESREDAPPLP